MYSVKDVSQMGPQGSLNRDGDNSKIEECLKMMDQMSRKIEKYEKVSREHIKQKDAYSDLLIKYNTIVYKMNTNTFDNSSIVHNSAMDISQQSNLRVKGGNNSETRRHPNNNDLFQQPPTADK